MRAFLGCPLAENDRRLLCAWMRTHLGTDWHAVPARNLHLTLCFLGERTAPALAALAAGLHALGPLPKARAHGIRVLPFPDPTAPLLALELTPDTGLSAVHAGTTGVATRLGLAADPRPFRPHITLARGSGGYDSQPLAVALTFTRLCLFASRAGPQGVTYETLNSWPLGDVATPST
ncbi:MAG: RNA 2',3'-cyclic phosphodiesterase [Porticoccaceae bacterium]|nr:RNA 2',3'-cyclic phosphodiesterase [Porticoccaceae bacterium]